MWNRRMTLAGVSVLTCCWLAAQVAAPLSAQQDTGPAKSDDNAELSKERDLDIRYAKAYLALLEATLAKQEEMNKNGPKTIRATVIQSIKEGVADARERVQQAQSDNPNNSAAYVLSAEANLRISEEILRKAEAARARFAGAVPQTEIDRLRAKRDLDKINVDKAKHLAAESPLSNLRYEVGQLREDVQELRMNVALLQTRN